jgi:hypothetical protein
VTSLNLLLLLFCLLSQVEYLGGMSRVKLAWLQVSVYEDHCKAMVEFKRESSRGGHGGPQCRFCETDITADNRSPRDPPSAALEHVCSAEDCQAKMDLVHLELLTISMLCARDWGKPFVITMRMFSVRLLFVVLHEDAGLWALVRWCAR